MTPLQKDIIQVARQAKTIAAKAQALKTLAVVTLEERKKRARWN